MYFYQATWVIFMRYNFTYQANISSANNNFAAITTKTYICKDLNKFT